MPDGNICYLRYAMNVPLDRLVKIDCYVFRDLSLMRSDDMVTPLIRRTFIKWFLYDEGGLATISFLCIADYAVAAGRINNGLYKDHCSQYSDYQNMHLYSCYDHNYADNKSYYPKEIPVFYYAFHDF